MCVLHYAFLKKKLIGRLAELNQESQDLLQKKVNTKDLVLNRREAIINFWNFFQLSGLIKTPHLLDFEKFSNTLSFLSRNLLFY